MRSCRVPNGLGPTLFATIPGAYFVWSVYQGLHVIDKVVEIQGRRLFEILRVGLGSMGESAK